MSYFSLTLPSIKETFLTKSLNVQDIIDINFLLSNKDIKGLDLFVEQKFLNYTNKDNKLLAFDKFAYLFSQRIFSVGEKIELKISDNKTKTVKLIEIYNDIIEKDFILSKEIKFNSERLTLQYPYNFSDEERIYAKDNENTLIPVSYLPVNIFKEATTFFSYNNDLIKQDSFKSTYNTNFSLNNEQFIQILGFIFNENVNSIYENFFTLCHSYNYDIGVMKEFTLRELYLHILVVNNYVKKQKREKKQI